MMKELINNINDSAAGSKSAGRFLDILLPTSKRDVKAGSALSELGDQFLTFSRYLLGAETKLPASEGNLPPDILSPAPINGRSKLPELCVATLFSAPLRGKTTQEIISYLPTDQNRPLSTEILSQTPSPRDRGGFADEKEIAADKGLNILSQGEMESTGDVAFFGTQLFSLNGINTISAGEDENVLGISSHTKSNSTGEKDDVLAEKNISRQHNKTWEGIRDIVTEYLQTVGMTGKEIRAVIAESETALSTLARGSAIPREIKIPSFPQFHFDQQAVSSTVASNSTTPENIPAIKYFKLLEEQEIPISGTVSAGAENQRVSRSERQNSTVMSPLLKSAFPFETSTVSSSSGGAGFPITPEKEINQTVVAAELIDYGSADFTGIEHAGQTPDGPGKKEHPSHISPVESRPQFMAGDAYIGRQNQYSPEKNLPNLPSRLAGMIDDRVAGAEGLPRSNNGSEIISTKQEWLRNTLRNTAAAEITQAPPANLKTLVGIRELITVALQEKGIGEQEAADILTSLRLNSIPGTSQNQRMQHTMVAADSVASVVPEIRHLYSVNSASTLRRGQAGEITGIFSVDEPDTSSPVIHSQVGKPGLNEIGVAPERYRETRQPSAGGYADPKTLSEAVSVAKMGAKTDVAAEKNEASPGILAIEQAKQSLSKTGKIPQFVELGAEKSVNSITSEKKTTPSVMSSLSGIEALRVSADATGVLRGQNIPSSQKSSVMDQLLVQLPQALAKGSSRVTLTLQPEKLGKLDVDIRILDNRVHIFITAQDRGVQQALLGQTDHLRDSLQRQGLQIDSLNVTLQDNHFAQDNAFGRGSAFGQDFKNDARNKDWDKSKTPARIIPSQGKKVRMESGGVGISLYV